jgi:hypothetical protein
MSKGQRAFREGRHGSMIPNPGRLGTQRHARLIETRTPRVESADFP